MIKLLILILITLALIAFGIVHFNSKDNTVKVGDQTVHVGSPSDTINNAKNAVQQTQNLQNQINQKAQNQLNQ